MSMVFPEEWAVRKGVTKWKSIGASYGDEAWAIGVTYTINNKEKMLSRYLVGLLEELLPITCEVIYS